MHAHDRGIAHKGTPGARRAALAVCVAGCGNEHKTTSTASLASCTGGDLGGGFSVVRGSAGAGQIVYRLTLNNGSDSRCVLQGLPELRLLDAKGKALPTRVTADRQGALAPKRIVLAPGASASATARFSPDVPGVGDAQGGRCQPVSARLRVSPPGGGSVEVPIRPPTSVCERGRLAFRALSASS